LFNIDLPGSGSKKATSEPKLNGVATAGFSCFGGRMRSRPAWIRAWGVLALAATLSLGCAGRSEGHEAGGTAPKGCAGQVSFKDAALDAAVRSALGARDGPLSAEQVASLEYLDAKGIGSLGGAECLTGLVTLGLTESTLGELTALSALAALRSLNLTHCGVTDLGALGALAQLERLDVSSNSLRDLDGLAGLDALTELHIDFVGVADLLPLSGLGALRALDAAGNSIADLSPLASLRQLERLALSGNDIESLQGLFELGALRTLDVSQNAVRDLEPLASLDALELVYVQKNEIEDLSPLSDHPDLAVIDARNNHVGSIAGLSLLPPKCGSRLELAYNPLDAAGVAGACDAGWVVRWGGDPVEMCNVDCLK
jgi:hypothetical protein